MTDDVRKMKTSELVKAIVHEVAQSHPTNWGARSRCDARVGVWSAELDRRIPAPVDGEEQRRAFAELMGGAK